MNKSTRAAKQRARQKAHRIMIRDAGLAAAMARGGIMDAMRIAGSMIDEGMSRKRLDRIENMADINRRLVKGITVVQIV